MNLLTIIFILFAGSLSIFLAFYLVHLENMKINSRFLILQEEFNNIKTVEEYLVCYNKLINCPDNLKSIYNRNFKPKLEKILVEKHQEIYKLKPVYDFENELAQALADNIKDIKQYHDFNTDDYIENIEKFKAIIEKIKINYLNS